MSLVKNTIWWLGNIRIFQLPEHKAGQSIILMLKKNIGFLPSCRTVCITSQHLVRLKHSNHFDFNKNKFPQSVLSPSSILSEFPHDATFLKLAYFQGLLNGITYRRYLLVQGSQGFPVSCPLTHRPTRLALCLHGASLYDCSRIILLLYHLCGIKFGLRSQIKKLTTRK